MFRVLVGAGLLASSLAFAPAEAADDVPQVWAERTARLRPLGSTPPSDLSADALAPVAAPPPARAHRGPAPPEPIPAERASREWDGTGELLLVPDFPPHPFTEFTVGASFRDADESAGAGRDGHPEGQSCMEGTYRFHLGRGTVGGLMGPDHSRYAPKPSFFGQGSVKGFTFTRAGCRLTMRLRVLVPEAGGWVEAQEAAPDPFPGSSAGEGPFLRPTQSFVPATRPGPAELASDNTSWSLGRQLPRSLADACPMQFGTLIFVPDGIRIMMPWISAPPITPGLRRDADARTTTLIFQTAACRMELAVDRETEGEDGLWTRSPLSPIGSSEARP